jgi:hypothetical protein
MVRVWVAYSFIYLLAPVRFTGGLSLGTLLGIGGGISFFVLGTLFRVNTRSGSRSLPFRRYVSNTPVLLFAALGLIGAALVVYARLRLRGLDFSSGIAATRLQQASPDTPLIAYLGLSTYGIGLSGAVFAIANRLRLAKRVLLFVSLGVVSSVLVTAVYGGRGGILLLVLVLFFAERQAQVEFGRRRMRKKHKLGVVLICLLLAGYSSQVFSDRRSSVGTIANDSNIQYWKDSYGISPRFPLTMAKTNGVVSISTTLDILGTSFYALGGPPSMNRTITLGMLPRTFGAYQVGLASPLGDRLAPGLGLRQRVDATLGEVEAGGLLVTAFGAFAVDFGWGLALFQSFLWGVLAQRIANRAQRDPIWRSLNALSLTFVVISPMTPPLGFSEASFLTLGCLVVTILLRRFSSARRPIAVLSPIGVAS